MSSRYDFYAKTGGLIMVAGIGTVGFQAVVWMKTGEWPHLPLRVVWVLMGSPEVSISWVGIQKVASWLLALPTAFTVFIIGAGIAARA